MPCPPPARGDAWPGVGILLAFLLLALPVYAGAWKLEIMGGKALGSAYAGNAVITEDASAAWFNPAAMTYLEEATVTGGSAFIDLSIDHHDTGTTSLLGQPITGPPVTEGGAFFPVPHGYAVVPFGERLRFGVGFNTPFGLGTDYGETWVGRYQAVNTELLVYNLNPSIGWRVSDELSIGGGINIQYADAAFGEMIDFGSIGFISGLPLEPLQHDGQVEITGDDWMIGWNVGVIWQPVETTMVGATYRSGTTARIEGPADFTVPPEAQALTGGGVLFQDSQAVAELPMPRTSSLSISHELTPRFRILGDVSWTDWSEFDQLVITFDDPTQEDVVQVTNWDDAVRVSVGGEYELSDAWTVRFGFADEPTPVPDETRDPRIPEGDHQWYTVGGTYSVSQRMDVDFFLVHLTTDDAPMQVSDPTAGTLTGVSKWTIWNAGVAASLKF